MTRRSAPQAKTDDAAFPVRVRFVVPANGLGRVDGKLRDWLDGTLGRGEFAWHGGGGNTVWPNSFALYFRTPADAEACLTAFPELELADGTRLPGYYSPDLPFGRPPVEDEPICNLYNQTTTQQAMRQLFNRVPYTDRTGNLEPGSVYPDQMAPIIRHDGGGLELVRARWGMPSPPTVLKTARDPGVTNVRNTASPHWRRWLGPVHRCLVPVTSFAEPLGLGRGNQWFAAADGGPMFFAGVEVRDWKSVRKVKDGETTDDLFAFLTTAPNEEVGKVHPKAMPVILTQPEEWERWLSAPWEMAGTLQRPLPDGALRLVDAPV